MMQTRCNVIAGVFSGSKHGCVFDLCVVFGRHVCTLSEALFHEAEFLLRRINTRRIAQLTNMSGRHLGARA